MSERTCVLVPGVCCEAEARMVSNALCNLAGVEGVDVDVLGKKAWIRHASAVSPADLVRALQPLDLGAALVAAAGPATADRDHAGHEHVSSDRFVPYYCHS